MDLMPVGLQTHILTMNEKKGQGPLPPLDVRERAFLDNLFSFMPQTECYKQAGYEPNSPGAASNGARRLRKRLQPYIDEWLDEEKLDDTSLKMKIVGLMEAKETKLIKLKGAVSEATVEKVYGVRTVGYAIGDEGEVETLVALDVEALAIQVKALDIGIKFRGKYPPQKIEAVGEAAEIFTEVLKRIDGETQKLVTDGSGQS